jgi:hypothetical protein
MNTSSKQNIFFTLAIVALVFFAGCKNSTPSTDSTTSTASSSSSSASKPAGCYNAYYPATATLKKTYKITYSGNNLPSSTYTESYGNLTSDGFTQKLEFKSGKDKPGATDVTVEGGVKCKSDGLAILDYGNLTAGQNLKYKYKTINTNGISFPHDSEWQVGKKWQMAYDVEGEMTEAPMAAMKMNPKGTITISCEILGKESITVATGTYDTFKVAMTFNSNLKMNMMGREMPFNTTFKSNVWFAKDVGMIKSSADEFKAVTELVALTK